MDISSALLSETEEKEIVLGIQASSHDVTCLRRHNASKGHHSEACVWQL